MDHIKLLKSIFEYTQGFSIDLYKDFLGELSKGYDRTESTIQPTSNQESEHVLKKYKIWRYTDNQWKHIDFLVIQLKKWWSVQKARLLQRNIVSNYLKDFWVYSWVDHVIAVFYADGHADWRLSFVKQQFKLDHEKKKVINEFTPAKRYSFLIEKWSKNQTVIKQSQELLKASTKPNINEIEKIFSVEKVTKEFFDNYKLLYAKLKEAFEKDRIFAFVKEKYNQGDPHFTENFVKKLLWQIVFLYFLQKKGWLGVQRDQKRWDGDQWFLRTLYNKCCSEKKLFFNDYLEPLFYDTLNKERPWHWSDYFGCKIPYLNGWLFQPINEYDWEGIENMLLSDSTSNGIFGEILDTFDTFNFTIYENDPLEQDVAVDPEMLWKVFENLLHIDERKEKGAFYTPREIVHYICKQVLLKYLAQKTGIVEDRIAKLIARKDSMDNLKKLDDFTLSDADKKELRTEALAIDNALKEVKIIDPAVWSWAFPMGILKEIVDLRRYIKRNILQDKVIPVNELMYVLKKETLSHCIYGVDLDPGAVEIAKLRFWLSLVVDYEGDHIEPLPNLDYKIMQGNSLIENPIIGHQVIDLGLEIKDTKLKKNERDHVMSDGLFEKESGVLLKRLTILHGDYFKETAPDHKKRLKKEIHDLEKRIIVQKAKETIANIESEISNNYHGVMTDKKAKELAEKYKTLNSIKEITDKLTEYGVKDYFPWRLHFGEIFREHWGFDIVIGNPPYVQLQKLKDQQADLEKQDYQTYSKMWDLYCLFYERWNTLLKEWWFLMYITSNKWMRAWYGESMRNYFTQHTNPLILIDLWPSVFETATVDSNIILTQKKQVTEYVLQWLNLSKERNIENIEQYHDQMVDMKNIWTDVRVILSPIEQSIKQKIEKVWMPLKDWDINIYRWILTGFNEAFIISGEKKNELIKKDPKSAEIIRPILRGRDIKKNSYEFADLRLIATFPSKKYNIDDYPAVRDYLEWFRPKLKQTWEKLTKIEIEKVMLHAKNNNLEINQNDLEKSRKKTSNKWFETQDSISYWDDFYKQKIVYSEIVRQPQFYLDTQWEFFVEATSFLMTGQNIDYLIDRLNSPIIARIFKRFYAGWWLGEDWYRYKKAFLEKLPLPKPNGKNDGKTEMSIYSSLELSDEEINFISSSLSP